MKRLLVMVFVISLMVCVNASASAYGRLAEITSFTFGEGVEISPKAYDKSYKSRETAVNGIFPSIIGSALLENEIEQIITSEISKATEAEASSITFDYKIVSSDEYDTISIIINSILTGGTAQENVRALVIDQGRHEVVTITDLLGGCGPKLATAVVNAYISSSFKSMPRISAIETHTDFYVTDEAVYFLFDKYEIAPGSEGTQAVPLYFDKTKNIILEKDDYYISHEKYNIKMLPLRKVARICGYDVRWNHNTQEITISASNARKSENLIKIKISENSYSRIGELTPQALEAPPEINNGLAYVPISFMEAMLDIYFHVESDGSIELAYYKF